MEPKIIFEDEQFMVIDKPAGMVVNRAETTKEETVQDWAEKRLKTNDSVDIESDFYKRAGVVHRLDKETSGLLLIGKTPEAFENLQKQFKERGVKKKYLALVSGEVKPTEGEIIAPVGRLPWDREKFGVFPGGKEATTKYRVVEILGKDENKYSFLELEPKTGRTHQIRVHLKYLGYPIVSDFLYGFRKKVKEQRRWCPRIFLHAVYLEIKHPTTNENMIFESKLPEDLKSVIDLLNKLS